MACAQISQHAAVERANAKAPFYWGMVVRHRGAVDFAASDVLTVLVLGWLCGDGAGVCAGAMWLDRARTNCRTACCRHLQRRCVGSPRCRPRAVLRWQACGRRALDAVAATGVGALVLLHAHTQLVARRAVPVGHGCVGAGAGTRAPVLTRAVAPLQAVPEKH